MVEDRLQDLDSETCVFFEIFFYENLFNSDKNRKIQSEIKLNKETVEMLLNELFSLNDKENEIKMEEYRRKSRCKNICIIKIVFNLVLA